MVWGNPCLSQRARGRQRPQNPFGEKSVFAEFSDLLGEQWINAYDKAALVKWKEAEEKRGFTARRRNKRLGFLSDFFKWAINHAHYDHANPCEGLRISTSAKLKAKAQSYQPFSDEELSLVFGSGYAATMNKPAYYWIPILGHYTGARIEELASLKAANIKAVDGVPCLYIDKGKNAHTTRHIPLHSNLINAGFLEYAQSIQEQGHPLLFPELKDGKNEFSMNVSRRFALWLDRCGITDPLKVFHSFRHTVITRLHATRAYPAHAMQITGHMDEIKGVHFTTYTHAISPEDLRETVELLTYPFKISV